MTKNDPKNSSTTKVSKPILSGFSKSTMSSFKDIENKNNIYWCKYCLKKILWIFMRVCNEDNWFKKKKNEITNKTNSRNYMKMKTFATFVKKSLKISKLKVKKIV